MQREPEAESPTDKFRSVFFEREEIKESSIRERWIKFGRLSCPDRSERADETEYSLTAISLLKLLWFEILNAEF